MKLTPMMMAFFLNVSVPLSIRWWKIRFSPADAAMAVTPS
jgi:hypothetical protein